MPQRKRSQARMLALQALCLYDAQGEVFEDQIDEFLRDSMNSHDVGLERVLTPDLISFARDLAYQTWRRHAEYDKMLNDSVTEWPIHRMAPVDRNILRLGLHELLEHPETPHQVVINEAVDLARRFGDVDSPKFVNGVLDSIRKESGMTPGNGTTFSMNP